MNFPAPPASPPPATTRRRIQLGSLRRGRSAALREIAVVVLGVLIALWVTTWNERRVEARIERQYLARLVEDLRADTAMFRAMLLGTENKQQSLQYLTATLRGPGAGVPDTIRFLTAVVRAANLSWTQPPVRRNTLDELESTGYLRLVSDPGLRGRIVGYYDFAARESRRNEARITGFGALSYRLVPHVAYGALGGVDPRRLEAEQAAFLERLSPTERGDLVRRVRESELEELVLAEENFARFYSTSQQTVRARAIALLAELERRLR